MPRTGIRLLVGAACLVAAACSSDVTPSPEAAPVEPIDMTIVAANIAFDPPTAVVRAGVPLRITLDNRDVDVPHNVQLLAGPGFGAVLAETEIVTGPATGPAVIVPGLVPGLYRFSCVVHPNMTSDLTVRPFM